MEGLIEIQADMMDKDGKFTCPKCGDLIDPEEKSTYTEIEERMELDNADFLLIQHNKCGQKIKIMLFEGVGGNVI